MSCGYNKREKTAVFSSFSASAARVLFRTSVLVCPGRCVVMLVLFVMVVPLCFVPRLFCVVLGWGSAVFPGSLLGV